MLNEKFNHYSFLLERTARRVKQFAQSSFTQQQIDLTVDQWTVIKTIYENGSMSAKELADKCGKDQPTTTRIVDLLVKKNYVHRNPHEQDRRRMLIGLTDLGTKQAESLAPIVRSFRMKAWENLSEEDFAHFSRILNTIYDNLNRKS